MLGIELGPWMGIFEGNNVSHAQIASQHVEECCWKRGDSGGGAMDVRRLPASTTDAIAQCAEKREFPRRTEWPASFEFRQTCTEHDERRADCRYGATALQTGVGAQGRG